MPKPNVMLEYGYALRARSHSVMIPVMNVAYGPADKLPFDMGHLRHPLQYQLPATAKNAERRAVRKALTESESGTKGTSTDRMAVDDYAALPSRLSIRLRSASKSMGLVSSASAPPANAFRSVSASP